MPTQQDLDDLRARFEASRSFEDDEEWIGDRTASSSRRSTLTAVIKIQPNPAVKKWAVQAAKPSRRNKAGAILSASKMKWEQAAVWEPAEKKELQYAPGEMAGGGETWMKGWRFDEHGRAVKIVGEEGKEDNTESLERLREVIKARKASVGQVDG